MTVSDTPLLYVDGFNFPDKKARLSLDEWVPPVVGARRLRFIIK